jgi:hypothetical protein
VIGEFGLLLRGFDVPHDAGSVSGGGQNLAIAQKTAARNVSIVSMQFLFNIKKKKKKASAETSYSPGVYSRKADCASLQNADYENEI